MKNILSFVLLFISIPFVKAQSLQVSLTLITPPCNNNGVVQINATGGTAPYTYYFSSWPGSSSANIVLTNNIISGLPAGSLFVSVTDAAGANAYHDTLLISPIQSTVTTTPAICPALGAIQISNLGNGPFIDELYFNGVLQATGAPFSNLQAGIYTVKTTDANGCFLENDSVNIENISGLTITTVESNVTCQGGTLTATVVGGLSPYSYAWSTGNSTSNVMTGPLGQHTLTVTDAQGCSQLGYAYLYSPVYIQNNAVTSNTICPNLNGSVTLFPTGGTAPYTCNWSNGATGLQLNNLNYGQYNGTIIDNAGCAQIISVYVGTVSMINAQVNTTNSDCLIPNGGAQLNITGGTAPYSTQWFSNPIQTGTTLQSVFPGTYAFVITDANGCVQTGSATIGNNDPLNYYSYTTASICGQSNGQVNCSAWGNNISYLWNTGSTNSSLYNVPGGLYSCVLTNASGCTKSFSEYVDSESPFNISSNITNASCIFTADGAINLNITGGTPPYNIHWNNGATSASISNLTKGDYYMSISDANGCNFSYHYFVDYLSTSPCACALTGKVYFDANNNCNYDNGEVTLSNVNVKLTAGTNVTYSITNSAGDYNFFVPTGTYTLEQLPYQHYGAGICSSNPVIINATGGNNCTINNNFADTAQAIQDLYTNFVNVDPAVVGYGYKQRVIVKNNGTTIVNNAMANVKGNYYAGMNFSTFPGNNVAGTDNWNFDNLPTLDPNETFTFDLNYQVLPTTPTNTLLIYSDTVQKTSQPWVQDATPWNNIKNLQTYTVSSLDPNYKEVSPKGFGVNGDINPTDTVLTYTVHFENTGNYFAYNIEVVDSISTNLDLNSLEMIYGSHPYTATIDENRVLHIKFNNIMLSYTDGWNTGFAVYTVKLKKNISLGSKVRNTAYIYFDFNEAVVTNTTVNTIVLNAGIENKMNDELSLFPNPTNDYLIISSSKGNLAGKIEVFDMMGKVWLSKNISQATQKVELNNLNQLANGIYFVNVVDQLGNIKTMKFVKAE